VLLLHDNSIIEEGSTNPSIGSLFHKNNGRGIINQPFLEILLDDISMLEKVSTNYSLGYI
jgi:hypothetical protein